MNAGDLEVWWIPQVPGKEFRVPVKDTDQAILLLDTLARYDTFQFENSIKPDYCNVGGLDIAEDGQNGVQWCEWENEDGEDIHFLSEGSML